MIQNCYFHCKYNKYTKQNILNLFTVSVRGTGRKEKLKMPELNNMQSGKTIVSLDKYSKTVLSVIAACLLLIVINIYFGPKDVNAYDTVQDVNIKSISGSSLSGGYLPIDLKRIDGSSSKSLRIDISSVNGRSIFGDKVPVDIQGINGQFFIGSDLPVKVK